MKKIFIVAIVLIMVFNFYCNITHQGDQRTPYSEFKTRIDGYSHYDKFIKSGKMLFAYPLTYPDSYKPAMPRLFKS